MTRSREMPDSSAAWGLPPKASSWRPGAVREKNTPSTAATISGANEQIGHGAQMPVAEGDQGGGHLVERDRSGDAEIDARERGCGRERDDEAVDAGARRSAGR